MRVEKNGGGVPLASRARQRTKTLNLLNGTVGVNAMRCHITRDDENAAGGMLLCTSFPFLLIRPSFDNFGAHMTVDDGLMVSLGRGR